MTAPTPPPTEQDGHDYAAEADILGRVTWHCSDEDGPPDVGISLGLGDGRMLWAGEISDSQHAESAEEVIALGKPWGWWLILYKPEQEVLGRIGGREQAHVLLNTLELVLRAERARADRAERERDEAVADAERFALVAGREKGAFLIEIARLRELVERAHHCMPLHYLSWHDEARTALRQPGEVRS